MIWAFQIWGKTVETRDICTPRIEVVGGVTEVGYYWSGATKEYLSIKNWQQLPSSLLNLSFALESQKL